MGNTEMIKVLETEVAKTLEKLDKILVLLEALKEQEKSDSSKNIDDGSQIMQNDLIFTSAGEFLNTEKEK
jgi:uncharacterized protein YacL (UPF0231 family)